MGFFLWSFNTRLLCKTLSRSSLQSFLPAWSLAKKDFQYDRGYNFRQFVIANNLEFFFLKKHALSKFSEFWAISTSIAPLRMRRKRNLHKIGTLLHEIGTLLHEIGSLLHEIRTLLHEIRTLLHEIRSLLHEIGSLLHEIGSLLHEIGTLLHKIGTLLQEWCDFDLNAYLC